MAQCIIVKKPDDGVICIIPNQEKYGAGKKDYSEIKALRPYTDRGLEWFLYEYEDLPPKSTLESRKQWYHDGKQVKADHAWEVRLMPEHCIHRREANRINQALDEELKQASPNFIKITQLQREKERLQEDLNAVHQGSQAAMLKFYERALKNLDRRTAEGEPDKPVIREKLQAKIKQLQEETKEASHAS